MRAGTIAARFEVIVIIIVIVASEGEEGEATAAAAAAAVVVVLLQIIITQQEQAHARSPALRRQRTRAAIDPCLTVPAGPSKVTDAKSNRKRAADTDARSNRQPCSRAGPCGLGPAVPDRARGRGGVFSTRAITVCRWAKA